MLYHLLSSTRHQPSHLESWNKSYQGGNYLLEIINNSEENCGGNAYSFADGPTDGEKYAKNLLRLCHMLSFRK